MSTKFVRTTTKMRSSKAQYKRHCKELEALRCGVNPPTRKQFYFCAVLLVDNQFTLEDWFRNELTEIRKSGLTKSKMCDVIKSIINETRGSK